ncbi:MAG: hypothetical protein JNK48_16355 [Bryobacterales bacterium]|nr:hypothetical protein [Bryobacterales bacterium]
MYTGQDRQRVRAAIVERASADDRFAGIAQTGSAAAGREDRWSDIDLAFGIHPPEALPQALADYTDFLYHRHGALHHLDIHHGSWTYRVFLLIGTLQVDLAFVPATDFRPLGADFELLSGAALPANPVSEPPAAYLIGFGWLYAIHARSAIGRGKPWQAEYMISGMRDTALSLACLRHGVPAMQGRGLDRLPADALALFAEALVQSTSTAELTRAFQAATRLLAAEIRLADPSLAQRLETPLMSIAGLTAQLD